MIFLLAAAWLFTGYGNKTVHPEINQLVVESFLRAHHAGGPGWEPWINYRFFEDQDKTLRGQAVIRDGLFSDMDEQAAGLGFGTALSSEGPATYSAVDWIRHGGFAADVPEVPASLRHFYDPTQPPGARHLTDIANSRIMGSLQRYALTNPAIDGVDWALGRPGDISEGVQDHKFTWEHGKIWMRLALHTDDAAKRDEYMAAYWRSLGETLHMLADNGCPPHVRDDAHPSPLWNNNTWFGNPDPYEELMDVLQRDEAALFRQLAAGPCDPLLLDSINRAGTLRELAHLLAAYTNREMVTQETIGGVNSLGRVIIPKAHPGYLYPSPRLDSMEYRPAELAYYSRGGVKQCVESGFFRKYLPPLAYPYVDMSCVKSQAARLLPAIVAAGVRAMQLYLPQLQVVVLTAAQGRVQGEVRHLRNPEYPDEIRYNGPVLLEWGSSKEWVTAQEGRFETTGLSVKEGEAITASVAWGGIRVLSSPASGGAGCLGRYEGTYDYQLYPEGYRAYYRSLINPGANAEARQAAEEDAENRALYAMETIRQMTQQAGSKVILSLARLDPAQVQPDWKTEGLSYIVINHFQRSLFPASFMPGAEEGVERTLLTRADGFQFTEQQSGGAVYRLDVQCDGQTLQGRFSYAAGGIRLYEGNFTARRRSAN